MNAGSVGQKRSPMPNPNFHCVSQGLPLLKVSEVPKIQVTNDIFIPDMLLFIISWRIKFNK